MKLPLGGGCMCGAVKYEILEAPLRVYACHCTDCQRVTGSAFSLGVVVSDDAFRAIGKERALAPLRIPTIAAIDSGFFRAFGAEDAGPIQQDAVEGIMPRQEHDAGGGRIWHDHTWSASAA
jgi:hypothetical protein